MSEEKKMAFKIIVIGDPSVGKTSLIRRYSDNKFDSSYLPTIGADFNLKIVELPNIEVILTIWDIGGHDRFSAIRSFYYQGAQAGILVFDRSRPETMRSIPNWMEDLQKAALEKIPIILMANKSDLKDAHLVSESEINGMASRLGDSKYFMTSAKEGSNVKAAFEEVAKLCAIE